MTAFVLIHGAWHGAWAWESVKTALEQGGHIVLTPTMAGLAEKQHLLTDNISLDSLVAEVVDDINTADLHNVVLVGHSFGGVLIATVAEQIAERVKHLVYLDAAILENGESMFSVMPPELVAERRQLAADTSNGLSLPTPSAEALGILDSEQWQGVKPHLTPHPLSSYDTPLTLERQPAEGFSATYIACTNPEYTPLVWARQRAKNYGWTMLSIDTGHYAMVSAPLLLAELLTTHFA